MFEYLVIFILGAVIGSFLNALIWRLSVGESVAHGRSYCTVCHHVLSAKDLIPLISFFLLRRMCRYCKEPISWRYPVIEATSGILFVLAYTIFLQNASEGFLYSIALAQNIPEIGVLMRDWFFLSVLLVLFVYDLRWTLLPDSVTLPAIGIGLVLQFIFSPDQILWYLVAGLVGAVFFGAQYIVSRGIWVGGGDIRLGALMGVMLGWPGVLIALFISYIVGALVALVLLALKRANRKSAIPFGPFLCGATALVLLYGDTLYAMIRTWYGI